MGNGRRSSDLEDPLEGYSGLTLFPRTFNSLPNPPRPYEPDDLNHTHNFLKSMPLQSSNKLLEQARAIVDSSSGLLDSEIQNSVASHKTDAVAKVIENIQERRPGLDRKRARFSLKPNKSQCAVALEPSLDIDKLKDPEEFFLAYEKFENAKREWQKQTGGVLIDTNRNNPSTRPRRPGIFGRRSVKYKHHYSTDAFTQETFEEDIFSPTRCCSQQKTNQNVTSEERELAGSVAKKEKRVSKLLDELLAGSYEELDGDGAVDLLQEHLQIKPIDLEKLTLPDLQDVRRVDLITLEGDLPKPRNPLSDVHYLLEGISSRKPTENGEGESSIHLLASPSKQNSPLASITLLRKRVLQSNTSKDSISGLNIDQSVAGNDFPAGSIHKQFDRVDVGKNSSFSRKRKSLMIKDNDTAVADACSSDVVIRDHTSPFQKSINGDSTGLGSRIHVSSGGSHLDEEDNVGGSSKDDCKLLTGSSEELNGDSAVSPLPERLQIKPIYLEKSSLPRSQNVRSIDLKTSEGGLPNPRNPLSVMHNPLKGISSRRPTENREGESSIHHLASPTTQNSPLSPIMLLKKRILQSNPSYDPFSALNIEQSSARNDFPPGSIIKESDQVDVGKDSSFSRRRKSLMINDNDTAVNNACSSDVVIRDLTSPFQKSVNDDSTGLGSGVHVGSRGSHLNEEDNFKSSSVDDGKLLMGSCEEFDGDRAVSPLKEHLKIKPIDLGKSSLPGLQDVQTIDLETSEGDLPKPRNPLSNIHNLLKGISSRTATENREGESSIHRLASPTAQNSPLASKMLLKKRIVQLNPSNDPFSAVNIEQSPVRNDFRDGSINKQADQADVGKNSSFSRKKKSLRINDNDTAVADDCSSDVVTRDLTTEFQQSVNDDLTGLGCGIHVGSMGSHLDREENVGGTSIADGVMSENLSRRHGESDANVGTVGPRDLDDKVEDELEEVVASGQPDLNSKVSTLEKSNGIHNRLDQSNPSTAEDHAMNETSETVDGGVQLHNKKVQKSRPNRGRETEALSRRKSLAAAGTSWESGIRRSTRIRSRPLEYWKGERFLYGRIHQSLATVIGIKYESPAKDGGKPALKVKSFVSDDYKDLVDLAALH